MLSKVHATLGVRAPLVNDGGSDSHHSLRHVSSVAVMNEETGDGDPSGGGGSGRWARWRIEDVVKSGQGAHPDQDDHGGEERHQIERPGVPGGLDRQSCDARRADGMVSNTPMPGEPLALHHAGRSVRLKWHKLRRFANDPPFLRANLRRGLAAGASVEVDLRLLADRRFVCLHDADLDRDTTGQGPVDAATARTIAGLRIRGTDEAPMLLEDLVALVAASSVAPGARVQLDLQIRDAAIDPGAASAFRRILAAAPHGLFILSGHDWQTVSRLGANLEGLLLGYDPSDFLPGLDAGDLGGHVRAVAPGVDTIYLSRRIIRKSGAAELVERLHRDGHLVDCWTIDHGDPDGDTDLRAALDAGVDQITTNTPAAWATSRQSTTGSTSTIS